MDRRERRLWSEAPGRTQRTVVGLREGRKAGWGSLHRRLKLRNLPDQRESVPVQCSKPIIEVHSTKARISRPLQGSLDDYSVTLGDLLTDVNDNRVANPSCQK